MRIHEVDPGEEALVGADGLQPAERRFHDLGGREIGAAGLGARGWGRCQVGLEALVETEARSEDEARHRRAGAEVGLGEDLGDRARLRPQPEDAVVPNAVDARRESGEQRGVRRQGDRRRRDGALEDHAASGQAIQHRGLRAAAPGPEPIGAGRIERHQQDVLGGAGPGRLVAASGRSHQQRQEECRESFRTHRQVERSTPAARTQGLARATNPVTHHPGSGTYRWEG
jgi:hypothetical protein